MKISKIRNVKTPTRGTDGSAGIDFYVPNDYPNSLRRVPPGERFFIPSGIKANVPTGYALIAFNKSGVATTRELQVGACVVDCGYQGEVHINLTNVGLIDQHINPGDKIVQVVLLLLGDPALHEVKEDILYSSVSSRGDGKFGSTGVR